MGVLYKYNLILNNQLISDTYLDVNSYPNRFMKVLFNNKEELFYISNVVGRNIYLSTCN